MTNVFLFVSTVLIWGTTWIAIAWQIGPVDLVVSVFYRFALACLVFIVGLVALGRLHRPSQWRFVVLQALCLFCFNFLCFYQATSLIPSGLVSVIFSLSAMFNAVNARLFFGQKISGRTVIAGGIGAAGVLLLFWQDLAVAVDTAVIKGVGWAALGTLFFSLGNMMSRKNSEHGVTPITANAWGMGIGATVLAGIALANGSSFTIPLSGPYMWALLYLSVVGSVLGFTVYLLMIARIGSDRAAYATVLFPVVALFLSTLFEGYVWSATALVGVALILVGNLVMFARRPARQDRGSDKDG